MNNLKQKIAYYFYVILRNHRFSYNIITGGNDQKKIRVLGMIRLKDEALVLQDTLDALSDHVDAVVIFDDASTDDSVAIAKKHPLVKEIIVNKRWRKGRVWEETANRRLLYQRAKAYSPEWFFYTDADERFEGKIYQYLTKEVAPQVNGIKIQLFDAYITPKDQQPYRQGERLYNFRKYFGVERRDILMIWRNVRSVDYILPDSREPSGVDGVIETKFFCQHYGKSLSIEQWEENCRYYSENFPAYSQKWKERMGKAIHVESDFGTELKTWQEVKKRPITI